MLVSDKKQLNSDNISRIQNEKRIWSVKSQRKCKEWYELLVELSNKTTILGCLLIYELKRMGSFFTFKIGLI